MKVRFLALLPALAVTGCSLIVPPPPLPTTSPLLTQAAQLATPTYPATPPPTATFAPTTAPISALGFTGRLIYTQGIDGLWQIDLATGEQSVLWETPERSFLAGVAASPDGSQLALAYSPPPSEGTPQLGVTGLYLANGDGAEAELVLEGTVQFESYINPFYSPDGEWLYFTHYQPVYDEQGTFSGLILNVERMPAEGGAPEVVLEGAQQATLSADGTRLTYLRFDLTTYATSLWVANVDGSEGAELVPDTAFFSMVGPHLTTDGARIVFGASGPLLAPRAEETPEALSVWEAVAGVFAPPVAAAHGPPWEVWEISAEGGTPTQLTNLFTDGPWPVWSPDDEHIAVLQPGGVLVLGEGDPIFLGPAVGHGELVWVP